MHIEGGETNRICLSASQQLLRGSPVAWKEVQLHDEMKHAFIKTESNIMFSPTACVGSLCLMYTQYSTVLHAFCAHMYIHSAGQIKAWLQRHKQLRRRSTWYTVIHAWMHTWVYFGSVHAQNWNKNHRLIKLSKADTNDSAWINDVSKNNKRSQQDKNKTNMFSLLKTKIN